jgi:DNA polymerase-1
MSISGRVLVIDQLNLFLRNYVINPAESQWGPIGGVRGTLQSLQKLCNEVKPDHIVICWDGAGGSIKRKQMKKDYKAGRAPIRLNRAFHHLDENETKQNRFFQELRLVEYFNEMPVIQFKFDNVEADDIVAYVCQMPELENCEKVIVSNDKDFYQLCSGKTVLMRPIEKNRVYNKRTVLNEFKIHPHNFALAKAMIGDKSDNLPGISGVGEGRIKKDFPMFNSEEQVTIDELLGFCRDNQETSKRKMWKEIVNNERVIRLNYKMMQLYAPHLSLDNKKVVRETIQDPDLTFNKMNVMKMMMRDEFGQVPFSGMFKAFERMAKNNQ